MPELEIFIERRCDNCANWQPDDPTTRSGLCMLRHLRTHDASTCENWQNYSSSNEVSSVQIKYPIDTVLGQLGIAVVGSAIFEYGVKKAIDGFTRISERIKRSDDKNFALKHVYRTISKEWGLSWSEGADLLGFSVETELKFRELYATLDHFWSVDMEDRINFALEIDFYLSFLLVDEPHTKRRWLSAKQPALNGRTPLECLKHLHQLWLLLDILRGVASASKFET